MSFISPSAHQKFTSQCRRLILPVRDKYPDQQIEKLHTDLEELDHLVASYQQTRLQLPEMAKKYKDLQRQIRIQARKIQPVIRRL